MTRKERKELMRLRNQPPSKRTSAERRRLLILSSRDARDRRVHDPIRPQEKP